MVVSVAMPPLPTDAVPIATVPSWNVTVPVGATPADPVTVADRVIGWPKTGVAVEAESAVWLELAWLVRVTSSAPGWVESVGL